MLSAYSNQVWTTGTPATRAADTVPGEHHAQVSQTMGRATESSNP